MSGMRMGFLAVVAGCGPVGEPELGQLGMLEGRVTWEAVFEDGDRCTYARTYTAEEDRSSPWLCPECTTMWRADVTVENRDCYDRVSSGAPAEQEWLGTDGQTWFRSTLLNYQLGPQGTVAEVDGSLVLSHTTELETDDGATVTLHVAGALTEDVAAGDPMHGWTPPESYLCGWPKADPPPYDGSWELAEGEVVPDGLFRDRCGQPVRLHDFAGHYVIIDIAASDCPPCQVMAAEEADFVRSMDEEGLPVEVVTLLAPSLAGVLDPTPQGMLGDWATYFGLDSPVLGDRGWGFSLARDALGPAYAYPTSIIVGPDLRVIDLSVGFASWDYHASLIRDDAR